VPRVRAEAVQQLTPELAERLAPASLVVFVDARRASEGAAVRLERLEPTFSVSALGHTSDPRYLLALAQSVYGRSPPAWWVTVPATDFELGESLSPLAERGVRAAIRAIRSLISRQSGAAREEPHYGEAHEGP
jgi:Ni,Fe-hydrogenase maturation factor